MLDEIHVKNYALVRDAGLSFSAGCTVLSGETGAGKTALVGAIKLLIGERGDVGTIRDGESELLIEGRIFDGSSEHVASRKLNRDGRSRCNLDEAMTTVKGLSESVGVYFDLHGQHEHQSLLHSASQLKYLDRFARTAESGALAAYQDAWQRCLGARAELDKIKLLAQANEQQLVQARYVIKEITALNPRPGEYEELEAALPILQGGEGLALASGVAYGALCDEGGVLELLSAAERALSKEHGVDARLDRVTKELGSLAIACDDIAHELRSYRDSVEFDPDALETSLNRSGELDGLRKRFGPRMEDVFASLRTAEEQLSSYEHADERIRQAEEQLGLAQDELRKAGMRLDGERGAATERLGSELARVLGDLAMEGAQIEFSVRPLAFESWTASGSCSYELLYKPSGASLPRALAKIASGGELSRVMLALKTLQAGPTWAGGAGAAAVVQAGSVATAASVVEAVSAGGAGAAAVGQADMNHVPGDPARQAGPREQSEQVGPARQAESREQVTLIFDEVDAGIGGVTAIAVAKYIKRLAEQQQVIVITHLAQIAAVADRHYVVEKVFTDAEQRDVRTQIREVVGEKRVAEIARMLSGLSDDTALEHARLLLAGDD